MVAKTLAAMVLVSLLQVVDAFVNPITSRYISVAHLKLLDEDSDNSSSSKKEKPLDEQWDEFLDKPFFEPERAKKGPLAWFANLVEDDYEAAEALFAGLYIVVLVVLTQEVLRMQLYGDAYVPFRAGGGAGSLF